MTQSKSAEQAWRGQEVERRRERKGCQLKATESEKTNTEKNKAPSAPPLSRSRLVSGPKNPESNWDSG